MEYDLRLAEANGRIAAQDDLRERVLFGRREQTPSQVVAIAGKTQIAPRRNETLDDAYAPGGVDVTFVCASCNAQTKFKGEMIAHCAERNHVSAYRAFYNGKRG